MGATAGASKAVAAVKPASAIAQLPNDASLRELGSWSWPDWAVQSRSPDIEVLVTDDAAAVSCWVAAVPQCRVVDRDGRDTFLSAQYLWEGEYFDEDFGPEQVRRRGSSVTVAAMLTTTDGTPS